MELVERSLRNVALAHIDGKIEELESLLAEIDTQGYTTIEEVKYSIGLSISILNKLKREEESDNG